MSLEESYLKQYEKIKDFLFKKYQENRKIMRNNVPYISDQAMRYNIAQNQNALIDEIASLVLGEDTWYKPELFKQEFEGEFLLKRGDDIEIE